MTFTPEEIQKAKSLQFFSNDLYETVTIVEWWKRLMMELNREEEGFSGKRPFGNGNWKGDAMKVFIEAGLVAGEIDEDGYVQDVDSNRADALFDAVIRSLA